MNIYNINSGRSKSIENNGKIFKLNKSVENMYMKNRY